MRTLTNSEVDEILNTIRGCPQDRVDALYERFKIQKETGMKLCNRSDGVDGHFCIGRPIKPDEPFYEYYNKGEWLSAGELFVGIETAESKLKELYLQAKKS